MEGLWKQHQPLGRAQQQQSYGGQVNSAVSQLNHHPYVAQEVCVIERTIRQETLGAANIINFGGLQGALKQHQATGGNANNQLLALVQQQSRHSGTLGAPLNSSYPQHLQLSPSWSACGQPQELYPAPTTRSVFNGVVNLPGSLERDITSLKNSTSRTAPALPEALETALLRKTNVDFFKDNLSRSGFDTTQCSAEQQIQNLHAAQPASTQKKLFNAGSTMPGLPTSTFGPRVSTLGCQGLPISGELLLTEKIRLEVICSCHGFHMSVAKFVQHAGSHSLNPGNVVYLETGETLVQWRRNLFSQVGVKVPDDQVGWDWTEGNACETDRNRSLETFKADSYLNSQSSQMAMLPTSMSYGIYQDTVLQGLSRRNLPGDVARDQPSQIQSFQENAMKFQKVVSKGPIEYPNTSTSEYIDFISPGGRAYSSPVEQQLGIRDKLGHNDQARKVWDGQENVRQEKENISSSFELRLGQPSQQGHKGASFGAFQSQFQSAIVQPNALMYGRAYQRTIDTNLEPTNTYGFQGLPGQANAHQFSQERLEKINVVNNQFGATGLERTVLSERAKLWEGAGMSQNAGNRVSSDQSFITSGQLRSQTPDSSLELLSVSQAKERLSNNRLLHDVVGFSGQIGPTLPSPGQQYLSQEFSQSTWTQRSSGTSKVPSETATVPSQTKEVMHCFDGARTSETILACRMSSASVATFVQTHQTHQLQQEGVTGPSPDGDGAPHRTKDIVSQQNLVDEQKRVGGDLSNALVEKEKQSDLTRETSPVLAPLGEDKALKSEDNRKTNDAENNNLHDLERNELLDDNLEHHHADTSTSIMPASSGLLVSVGENDLPLTRGHPEKHLAGQSSGWKTPPKSFPMDAVDGGQNSGQARQADKSTSVDGEDETSSKKELQSDVSTKSSENVLSGFSDARHRNEETSTLESGSPKHDAVDEGSGIGKCSSEEQASPDKKLDSTVSGHEQNESPASSSRRGGSSSEANDSVMVEGLQATTQQCRTNDDNRKKKPMKWKCLNAAFSNVPAEASKGTDSGLSGSPATPSDQQKREPEKADRKLAPKQKRSSRTSRNQPTEHPVESIRGKRDHTLLKIRVPQLRERPNRSRKEEHADLVQEPSEEANVTTDCKAAVRRHTVRGSSKMMSLNSIMKLPAEHVNQASNLKKAEVGPKDDPGASRKETRKRKLSDLETAAVPQCHQEVKAKPVRVGPGVVPRGERSPRFAPKKARCVDERQLDKTTNDIPKQTSFVPKRRRDAGPTPRRSADDEMVARKRNNLRHQTASTTHSSIDEPTREPKETKWKSLKDSFDPLSRKHLKRAKVQPATCSVCSSSQSESHNQLIHCSCCPVKVHQACYGVPKVPKVAWACRPCKTKSDNAVCVLCGYSGGAMTRAQNARAAVKSLLRVWNAVNSADGNGKIASKQLRRSVRTSFKQGDDKSVESDAGQVSNSVTESANDPTATQWIHMVCALWMPGTRCLNLGTMGMFDVSGVSIARRRMTCSICKRQGGSCIQCHEPKCAIPFHAWCAHTKGLLQIETVNDTSGHVRFHGKCTQHGPGSSLQQVNSDIAKRGTSASKCARTEGYTAKQRTVLPAPEARKNTVRRLHPKKLE